MISPIFHRIYSGESHPCTRVRVDEKGKLVDWHTVLERSASTPVHSLEVAEDAFLSYATELASSGANVAVLAIGINRAAQVITARTRRAPGDTVFMHPDLLMQILASPWASPDGTSNPTTKVGRWTMQGKLNNLTLYTSPHLRKTDAFVAFLGNENDRPACLFEQEGQLSLAVMTASQKCLGTIDDYITKVKGPEHLALWISPK